MTSKVRPKKKFSPIPEDAPLQEEKVLFKWEAVGRPFQKKDFEFWTTVIAILSLVCLILFFAKEWFLIVALISLVFLYYVLTTVEPRRVKHKITNKGIYFAGSEQCFDWPFLRSFWFSQKWGHGLVNVETAVNFPRILHLVFADKDKKKLEKVLSGYLPQEKEEAKKGFVDRFSAWLLKNLPLEAGDGK